MAESNTLTWVLGVAATVLGTAFLAGTGAIIKNGADIQALRAEIAGIENERIVLKARFEKATDRIAEGRVERAKLQEQIKALQK